MFSYQTLSVKGTTIIGFDADKSVSKTLRKPEEQLKEFAKAGKIALRTFMKDIKAVETKLNGRIGIDILLLKAS
jgi:putative N-acetylmannosamine-6-phosphate epimerase